MVANKRILPTTRIIEFLVWQGYFTGVYALDLYTPQIKTKAELLGRIVAIQQLNPQETLYIGDRHEDGEETTQNAMPFLIAMWGDMLEKIVTLGQRFRNPLRLLKD